MSARPQIAVAEAQYWNEQHMHELIADQHIQVLIPPDSGGRTTRRPDWAGGRCAAIRSDTQRAGLAHKQGDPLK
ncbi:MAG TPA: hypothetical protein VIY10_03120 [Solirubrobacteraceae bacterium]